MEESEESAAVQQPDAAENVQTEHDGDVVHGDKVGGDKFSDISVQGDAVAFGRGARAAVYHGLTVEQVADLVVQLKHKDQPVVWDGRVPYPGLSAFRESDAQFFFGREGLVDDLLVRVQAASFVAIAGPSGSGKSSVARAGLFHALRQGRIDRSDTWLLGTMQPKGDPIEQLALGIERMVERPKAADYIRQGGAANPAALKELIETLLSDDPRQRCVLLVDQFEEVFTQTKDDEVRAAFIGLLTSAVQLEGSRIIIVLCLRSDFVSQCAVFSELRALMSQQFQLVGAMEPRDLTRAITLPALEVGAEIDPALVSRIMDDMHGEPGALPLMSFALRDLFEAEKSRKGEPMDMTLAEYLNRGGIESALERHANKVFNNFTNEQKELAHNIFSKLIEVGQGRVDTRRTATFGELVPSGAGEETVAEIVRELAQEGVRLITTSGGEGLDAAGDGNTPATVTIAHEKLIDAWPWLRRLVDENREVIGLVNQINEDARAWEREGDAGFLYRGGRLIQVEEKLETLQPTLDELSQRFVQASLNERQEELEKEEARRRRELEQERALAEEQRKRAEEAETAAVGMRRRRNVASGFAVGAMALAALAFFLFQLSNQNAAEAVAQATVAANNLTTATLALGLANDNAATATRNLATAEAAQGTAEAEAIRAIAAEATAEFNEQLAAANAEEAIAQANIAQSRALAVSSQSVAEQDPMGALLLAIEAGKTAETTLAMDALNNRLLEMPKPLHIYHDVGQVLGVTWNEERNRLISWGCDEIADSHTCLSSTAKVWDITNKEEPLLRLDHEDWIVGAVWNRSGDRVLTWSSDGTAKVWDANTQSGPLLIFTHQDSVLGGTWNEDESRILTWSSDATAMVWDVNIQSEPLMTMTHEESVIGAIWNKDENRILTWSDDGTAKVWDAAIRGDPILILSHEDTILGASWNIDESQILTWSDDGTAKVWDSIIQNEPLFTLSHRDSAIFDLMGAVWNKDESRILTWSQDGTARIWDVNFPEDPILTLTHDDTVATASWNEDESRILTLSYAWPNRVLVWNANVQSDPLITLIHEETILNGATWNKDESRILTWTDDGKAKVWDDNSRDTLLVLDNDFSIDGATWIENDTQILTWSQNGTIQIWDHPLNDPLLTLTHEEAVFDANWNKDENHILTWTGIGNGNLPNHAQLWDVASGENVLSFDHTGWWGGPVWSSNGSRILSWYCARISDTGACTSGIVRVLDADSGDQLLTVEHEAYVFGATWNKDESRILSWSEDGTAQVWDVASGNSLLTIDNGGWNIGAAWNGDEDRILTWSHFSPDGVTRVWDADSGNLLLTLNLEEEVIGAVWNRTGSRILTWSRGGMVKVWDAKIQGDPLLILTHENGVRGAAWNGDGSRIITWSDDRTAKIWDAEIPGDPLLTLTHESWVRGAAWNGDESRIITWSDDRTAKIWDASSGERLITLSGAGARVTIARWNQDESRILLGTESGMVRVYYTSINELASVACQYTTRNFNWNEWQAYFPGQPYERTCEQWPVHPSVPFNE